MNVPMINWFSKRRLMPGRLVVGVEPGEFSLTHVAPVAGRLELTRCERYQKEGTDAESLTRLCKGLKLEQYRCSVVLPFGEYQILQVEPPAVPPEELRSAIRWRIKDMIDFPVEEATIDVLELPSEASGAMRNRLVHVVAAPNKVIERYVRLFQYARVPLDTIDIQETAQRNVAALFEPPGRGIALLAFTPQGGLLTFTSGGELYMSRRIDIGLPQLMNEGDDKYAALERIVLELQRSLDNFDHQFHFIPLAKLVVGPVPESIGLAGYLGQNLYLPVEAADLGAALDMTAIPELAGPENQSRYLPLIGGALRDQVGERP